MKLLTLLPEDWKGETDVSKADFCIDNNGVVWIPRGVPFATEDAVSTYYTVTNCKPVELTPEPRPADSMKLSECDGSHVITGISMSGQLEVIRKEYDAGFTGQNMWTCRAKGMFILSTSSPQAVIELREITDVKIYDTTK